MRYLEQLAERRIAEAIERGEFDQLPGQGRPLPLDDEPLVPAELRTAYRILRNSGYVPAEVEALREIGDLERLLDRCGDPQLRGRAARRLELLWERLGHRTPAARAPLRAYRSRLLARFSEPDSG